MDFLYSFLFHGASNALLSWIRGNYPMTVEEFGKRMALIGKYCLMATREF